MNQTNPCKEYNVPKITEVNGHNNVVITLWYRFNIEHNIVKHDLISRVI